MNSMDQQQINNDPASTISLIERHPIAGKEPPSRLRWWHRIAAPPAPSASASLKEREAWRRGRYISNTLLTMISVLVLVTIFVGGIANHALLPNFIATIFFLALACFFNQRGLVIVSGIIVVLVLDISIAGANLAFTPLDAFELPLLDLLVLPALFAASLLPAYFVFFDMLLHIIFVVCVFTFLFPKNPALVALLHNPGHFADGLAKPIVIQIVTAVVAYTWMRSVSKSVERADRATSIALLERSVSEQAQREAGQKHLLENEIRGIIDVQTQVANGNYEARVPLRQGNILWPVAGSLNNLIVRFQYLLKESQRLQRIDNAVARFFHARNQAQNGPIAWQPTGTSIDRLVQQHNLFAGPPGRQRQE
ncbi:MAG TPA: hypothetical protein VH593_01275 [Ktedonobacteraceae bacterium]|jgi:hypothetical protein